MPPANFFKFGRRNGSVLAAVMMLGLAAVSLSVLCLAVSNAMFKEFHPLSEALKRENAAREALELSSRYFISDARRRCLLGEEFNSLQKTRAPIRAVPSSELAALSEAHPNAVIEAEIIDLNYDLDFREKAAKLGIPEGRASVITTGGNENNGHKTVFTARRYEIRSKVTLQRFPKLSCTMTRGLLLLFDSESRKIQIIGLYLKKQLA